MDPFLTLIQEADYKAFCYLFYEQRPPGHPGEIRPNGSCSDQIITEKPVPTNTTNLLYLHAEF